MRDVGAIGRDNNGSFSIISIPHLTPLMWLFSEAHPLCTVKLWTLIDWSHNKEIFRMLTWLLLNQIYLEVSHLMIFHILSVPLNTEQTNLIKQSFVVEGSKHFGAVLHLIWEDLCWASGGQWATLTSHLRPELGDAITLFPSRGMFMLIIGASSGAQRAIL